MGPAESDSSGWQETRPTVRSPYEEKAMQNAEQIYITGLSLCIGLGSELRHSFSRPAAPAAGPHAGVRLVVLSADAPEWAATLLRRAESRPLAICCS
jgi:hypothetical protein